MGEWVWAHCGHASVSAYFARSLWFYSLHPSLGYSLVNINKGQFNKWQAKHLIIFENVNHGLIGQYLNNYPLSELTILSKWI